MDTREASLLLVSGTNSAMSAAWSLAEPQEPMPSRSMKDVTSFQSPLLAKTKSTLQSGLFLSLKDLPWSCSIASTKVTGDSPVSPLGT